MLEKEQRAGILGNLRSRMMVWAAFNHPREGEAEGIIFVFAAL